MDRSGCLGACQRNLLSLQISVVNRQSGIPLRSVCQRSPDARNHDLGPGSSCPSDTQVAGRVAGSDPDHVQHSWQQVLLIWFTGLKRTGEKHIKEAIKTFALKTSAASIEHTQSQRNHNTVCNESILIIPVYNTAPYIERCCTRYCGRATTISRSSRWTITNGQQHGAGLPSAGNSLAKTPIPILRRFCITLKPRVLRPVASQVRAAQAITYSFPGQRRRTAATRYRKPCTYRGFVPAIHTWCGRGLLPHGNKALEINENCPITLKATRLLPIPSCAGIFYYGL